MSEVYDDLDELPAPPRKEIPPADFELLVLAARAINADFEEVEGEGYGNLHFPGGSTAHGWNPLQFSDDAFELAVRLNLHVLRYENMATVRPLSAKWVCDERDDGNPSAATRRAVVRAAAEIIRGKRFLNEIS